jgi:hypothetical protein
MLRCLPYLLIMPPVSRKWFNSTCRASSISWNFFSENVVESSFFPMATYRKHDESIPIPSLIRAGVSIPYPRMRVSAHLPLRIACSSTG